MNKLALYCRIGFEKELAAEITDKASELGVFGFARVENNSGYVIFECFQAGEADYLAKTLPFEQLIFARQMIVVSDLLADLSPQDRISPIIAQYERSHLSTNLALSRELWVETADTNEAKELSGFCRKFTVPLRQAMKSKGWLGAKAEQKCGVFLHLFFIRANCCYVGYSYCHNHSPYFMGIPRLKFPPEAPSRSTLKLEEAILTFIPKQKESQYLNENHYAVDLGACPGGWTYQLVKRGLFVYAVDHGKMAASLHDTGRIEHCAEDGFKFQPPKRRRIDWLVCDMVEQPSRITQLIIKWLLNGWCQATIFNLKLPMKKRYAEVKQCLEMLQNALEKQGIAFELKAKHLYHDREEITVYLRLLP
ncbi:23S rRNA (cytidine(2498)-2'-O)-methyltransferase RlmM [Avibacterium paragallinarum]|uniref:Ribosomal RNA large subunit methyltransferase M n=1 Tax=Avibacterium paragallinarum TaxID=728 RepID=A0A0F5EZ60_AVIPA|nr:23S rRNA (cytidine(2498)-2'-O)-methyltransferase RlmM [Avibacterium paragallinarum]KAA6209179.1 23S rRNA (cytidine(2498)-2'-O)-methyltransferase RlmM [Avibacterium paragallinarum]KKB01919.1 ribosomal RNA large subunit methyltransferase M [Avibacterium paragallinarum]POY46747.1 23S rRNA (cytidine(2498)-2'-O)-methyltransferase RlmM [Avibacterium paragallinarum]RZN61068.1 23S rRNA (cytidine(2498)-2'-O)-methyltransferase RlmM [Avibacterium paragallinarum]RZN72684.1 23S rRNA (cytidine(2498)-2'-O